MQRQRSAKYADGLGVGIVNNTLVWFKAVSVSSLKRGQDVVIGGDSQLAMLPFPRVGRSVTAAVDDSNAAAAAAAAAPPGGQRRNLYGEKRTLTRLGRDAFSAESMLPFPRVGRSQPTTSLLHRIRGILNPFSFCNYLSSSPS